jgi:hypothetical protein
MQKQYRFAVEMAQQLQWAAGRRETKMGRSKGKPGKAR